MARTTVTCECGAEVIPSLAHREGDFLNHRLTEHICPVCGTVMYTTGGGLRPFVKPLFSILIPALLFVYAYFCAKTGYWRNAALLGLIASAVSYYNFPALTRKAASLGFTWCFPALFVWIAVGIPATGGENWIAVLFYVLAAGILYLSHWKKANLFIRRFISLSRPGLSQGA
jgi:hypothetical protein